MEKQNLIISVSGQAISGKSRLTFLLKKFLREQGFEVELSESIDYKTELEFNNMVSEKIDDAIENIKQKSKILLKEVQLPRN